MYELIAKKDDNWVRLDLSEFPAMNYQANKLGELKDRFSNFSQALKLPKTKINKDFFEGADILERQSLMPFQRIPCVLYVDNIDIANNNGILYLREVTDKSFEVQILSGNKDFFEVLKEVNFEDSSILGYVVKGDTPTLSDITRYEDIIYADDPKILKSSWFFINYYEALKKIITSLGYSLSIDSSYIVDNIQNDSISLASDNPTPATIEDYKTEIRYIAGELNSYSSNPQNTSYACLKAYSFIDTKKVLWGVGEKVYENPFTGNGFSTAYSVKFDGEIEIGGYIESTIERYYDENPIYKNERIRLEVSLGEGSEGNRTKIIDFRYEPPLGTSNINTLLPAKKISVKNGQTIRAYIWVQTTYNYLDEGLLTIRCRNLYSAIGFKPVKMDSTPNNALIEIAPNSGFKNAFDFFKTFLLTYGLIAEVKNNTINCFPFSILYDNKAKAKNWTNKLIELNTINYQLADDYAQKNYIAFEKTTYNDVDFEDKGTFEIDNKVLNIDKEVFKLDYGSGKDVAIDALEPDVKLAYIPIFEGEGANKKVKETKPHFVSFASGQANHITAQNIVDNYYADFIKILRNGTKIEVLLNLNAFDIRDLDFRIPIYFEQLGQYFYVEKVSNYIAGKLTKVELVKL